MIHVKPTTLFLTVVVATIALATSCGGRPEPETSTDPAATPPADEAVPVHTRALEKAAFVDVVKVYGRVVPKKQVRIVAEAPGIIEARPHSEGDRVTAGTVLARINARVVAAQLKQAEANHELQAVEAARMEQLVEKKLATPQQLTVARAQRAQAEAALELARANLDKAVIRSPLAGVVTRVAAERGEMAGMGVPLLEVVDVDEVDVVAEIGERDIALLESGREVALVLQAFPDRVFTGRVHEIGLMANNATRTFPVKVRLANAEGLLRPGMLASLDLERRRLDEVVVIPRDAVIDEVDGKAVFVVEGGVARRRAVVLGPTRGRFAVALAGVGVGDELVVLGHRQVVDGQPVRLTRLDPCCAAELASPAATSPETLENTPIVNGRAKN